MNGSKFEILLKNNQNNKLKKKDLEVFFKNNYKTNNNRLNVYSIINLKHKLLKNFSSYLDNEINNSIKFIKKKNENYKNYKSNKHKLSNSSDLNLKLKINKFRNYYLIDNNTIKINKKSSKKLNLKNHENNKEIEKEIEKINKNNQLLKKELNDYKDLTSKYINNQKIGLDKENKIILSILRKNKIKLWIKYKINKDNLIKFRDNKFNNIIHYMLKEENIKYFTKLCNYLKNCDDFKNLFLIKNINRNSPFEIIKKKIFFKNKMLYDYLKNNDLI